MVGAEDGVTDALFKFTPPVSGSYFWCPPMAKGRLDLRALDFWLVAPLPAVTYTPFKHAKLVRTRLASKRIDINHAEQIIPATAAADALDLATCTTGTDKVGMAPMCLRCLASGLDD